MSIFIFIERGQAQVLQHQQPLGQPRGAQGASIIITDRYRSRNRCIFAKMYAYLHRCMHIYIDICNLIERRLARVFHHQQPLDQPPGAQGALGVSDSFI